MAEEKETESTESEGKKSSSLMLIVIIIVLILVILVGAIVGILMMGGDDTSTQQVQQKVEQSTNMPRAKKTHAELDNSRPLNKIGILYPLDPFTVNLLSESGSRYLKAQISLELSGQ